VFVTFLDEILNKGIWVRLFFKKKREKRKMKVKWLPINHGHKFPKSVVPHCRKTNANLDEIVELAKQLLGSTVGSCRRLLLGSTVGFC
jgi:hypothetical protein